jgi:hypothetical protein
VSDMGIDAGALAVIARISERYPSYTWLFQNPEIGRLLWQASTEEWSPEVFQSRVQATEWWRGTSESQRQWQMVTATDPATADRARAGRRAQVEDLAAQIGAPVDSAILDDRTERSLAEGWQQEQLRDAVAANWSASTGQGAASMTDLRALTKRYMVDTDDATYMAWARDLASGRMTTAAVEERVRQMARAQYPQLVEQIDQGIPPADFAGAYKRISEKLTGRPADTIDVTSALSFADPSSGKMRPMTYDEWTKQVRASRDFADGAQGRAEAASFGMAFQRLLGVRA